MCNFASALEGVKPGESASDGGLSQLAPRTELGAVTYEYNVLVSAFQKLGVQGVNAPGSQGS